MAQASDQHAPSAALLETNLRLIEHRSPHAASTIRAAGDCLDARFRTAPDGGLTGLWGFGENATQLASLRAPLAEAARFAEGVDLKAASTFVLRGFGVGHHAAALADRLRHTGLMIVYEPDAALLRAVLERQSIAGWMQRTHAAFVVSPDDQGELVNAFRGLEGVIAGGVRVLDHPSSKARLAPTAEVFGAALARVVQSVRTNVVTTLGQSETTLTNLIGNAGAYCTAPGVADLENAAKGKAAVVVSAGPSLHRNVELLREPSYRERVVVVATQTVLKTLLARGVRPDFVTALDYHEISARFYEGLTEEQVRGVTLVVEAKANPAILRAFPGPIRCTQDPTLDRLLGPELARPMGELPAGSTVAHLAYYLARHLGCDPVIFIGQDLGFTDGQYYAPGAAIHQVWSGELSDFCTLETMEWQRIMRMRTILRTLTDQQGRPIYSDEQMAAYLVQFERDFAADERKGLSVIDATEGGVRKQHTRAATFRDALDSAPAGPVPPLPEPRAARSKERLKLLDARLAALRRQAGEAKAICSRTLADLDRMNRAFEDERETARLVDRAHANGREIAGLDAYYFMQMLNQVGAVKRFRADREIKLDPGMPEDERRRRRIERDRANVGLLEEAAGIFERMIDEARGVARRGTAAAAPAPDGPRRSVWAVSYADPARSALFKRDLGDTPAGRRVLERTIDRVLAVPGIDGVCVLCDRADEARVRSIAASAADRVRIVPIDGSPVRAWRAGVRSARVFTRHCWRAGIANVSAFDEVAPPRVLADAAAGLNADAVFLFGDDWCALDSALSGRVVARYRDDPVSHRLTFTPSPPGLAGCVADVSLLRELAEATAWLGTIGAVLGYTPLSPRPDPIAKPWCVQPAPIVRDTLLRCTWDDANFRALAADRFDAADAPALCAMLGRANAAARPEVLSLDLRGGTDASVAKAAAALRDAHLESSQIAVELIASAAAPWQAVADAARALGVAVHTRLSWEALRDEGARPLIDAMELGVCVVSVDMPGDTPETWRARAGSDTLQPCWDAVQEALNARTERAGPLPATWFVPRLERCDATYLDIEGFVDRWMLTCGWCVLDPAGSVNAGDRITPLPEPASVVARRAWSRREAAPAGAIPAAPAQRAALPGAAR